MVPVSVCDGVCDHPLKQSAKDVSSDVTPVVETYMLNALQDIAFFYKAHILVGQVHPDPD